MKKAMTGALAMALLGTLAAFAQAQQPAQQAWTRVTLEELHCQGCVKKLNGKVTAVSGVAEMRVDMKAKTIWAIHKQGTTPSPKALWEAVEEADQTPTRMDAPSGSYTSKPRS